MNSQPVVDGRRAVPRADDSVTQLLPAGKAIQLGIMGVE